MRFCVITASVISLVSLATGCATKTIVSEWSNPAYSAPRFEKIMVLGVTEQTAIRRNFEDELAAGIRASGVEAVPSYTLFPENGMIAEGRLKEGIKKAGVDAVIMTRLTRVGQRTEVTPGYYDLYPSFGFYRWYSSAWYGLHYTPSRVYTYPVVYSETTLHDVVKDEIVWTGTLRLVDPEDAGEAIKEYVATILAALREKNLLPRDGNG